MRTLTLVLLLTVPALGQFPRDPNPEPPPDPPKGPVSVKLVAAKTDYVLDRGGMTAAKYAEAIKEGKITPPTVELVLEVKNTSKEDIQLRVGGPQSKLKLDVKGKVKLETRAVTRTRPPTSMVILKPGEVHKVTVDKLAGYWNSAVEDQHFWTEAGEYTLTAEYSAYIITTGGGGVMAPGVGGGVIGPGVRMAQIVTAKSRPIRVSVTEK